jgi:hypothetical protein
MNKVVGRWVEEEVRNRGKMPKTPKRRIHSRLPQNVLEDNRHGGRV